MSKIPVVKQISWLSFFPQILLMLLLIFLYHSWGFANAALYAAVTYLVLSFSLRLLLAGEHGRGVRLVKRGKFKEAIVCFEKSADFFKRYRWIDTYRWLLLLSASHMYYREMALCNMAFCYAQTGRGKKARDLYALALQEFPRSGLAQSGLNMMQSMEKNKS